MADQQVNVRISQDLFDRIDALSRAIAEGDNPFVSRLSLDQLLRVIVELGTVAAERHYGAVAAARAALGTLECDGIIAAANGEDTEDEPTIVFAPDLASEKRKQARDAVDPDVLRARLIAFIGRTGAPTQSAIAASVGIKSDQLSRFKTGERPLPTPALTRLEAYLQSNRA